MNAIERIERTRKTQFRARPRHARRVEERRLRSSPPDSVSGREDDPENWMTKSAADNQQTRHGEKHTRGPFPRIRDGRFNARRLLGMKQVFLVKRREDAATGSAAAAVLTCVDMLPKVRDAIEVLTGRLMGSQWPWALVEEKVPEGTLVGLGQADHGNGVLRRKQLLEICCYGKATGGWL